MECVLKRCELQEYHFVNVFEKAWNANLYKCVIQEQLWALFELRNVYIFFYVKECD